MVISAQRQGTLQGSRCQTGNPKPKFILWKDHPAACLSKRVLFPRDLRARKQSMADVHVLSQQITDNAPERISMSPSGGLEYSFARYLKFCTEMNLEGGQEVIHHLLVAWESSGIDRGLAQGFSCEGKITEAHYLPRQVCPQRLIPDHQFIPS